MSKINERDIVKNFLLKASGATRNKIFEDRVQVLKENYGEDIESSADISKLAKSHENIERIAIECLTKNLIDERSSLYDIIQICMDKNNLRQDEATAAIMVTLKKALENYKNLIS